MTNELESFIDTLPPGDYFNFRAHARTNARHTNGFVCSVPSPADGRWGVFNTRKEAKQAEKIFKAIRDAKIWSWAVEPGHEIDTGGLRTPDEKAWDESTRG